MKQSNGVPRTRLQTRGLKPQKTAILLAQRIVGEITDEGLAPGSPLPPEHQMLENYGVARGTLREALRFLEIQGVLAIRPGPGGGPVVTTPDPRHLASTLALLLQLGDATYRSILEAREIAEPALAARAATRATPEQAQALHASVERMQTLLDDEVAFLDENRVFHNLIAEIADNELFRQILAALNWIMDGTAMGVEYPRRPRGDVSKRHREIADAIAAGDADLAAERMLAHMGEYGAYVRRHYAALIDQPIRWEDVSG